MEGNPARFPSENRHSLAPQLNRKGWKHGVSGQRGRGVWLQRRVPRGGHHGEEDRRAGDGILRPQADLRARRVYHLCADPQRQAGRKTAPPALARRDPRAARRPAGGCPGLDREPERAARQVPRDSRRSSAVYHGGGCACAVPPPPRAGGARQAALHCGRALSQGGGTAH